MSDLSHQSTETNFGGSQDYNGLNCVFIYSQLSKTVSFLASP